MTLPAITPKQRTIPPLLHQFRFLNNTHIQSLLHHKDEARINIWLKDLTKKEYVKRIYDNTIVGKNRVPAIYYLAINGIRFLKEQGIRNREILNKLYYEKNRSESFINHCLFVATVCCQLDQKNTDGLTYTYTTEGDLSNPENQFHFLKENNVSFDLCFSKKQEGKDMQYYILKLFDETLPKYRIQKQLRDLKEFYFSNEWENNLQTSFPTILLIGETKERMIYFKRYAKSIFEDEIEDIQIHSAIVEDVRKESITGQIWETI